MPGPIEILWGLNRIANEGIALAIAWHVLVGLGVAMLARGARPSGRVAGLLAVSPLVSVGALAWTHGNPFNSAAFALLAAVLALVARGDRARIVVRTGWERGLGGALIAFAWVYPHFLATRPVVVYLVAAPMGLLPCPTLALLLGLSLLGVRPRGAAWPTIVSLAACVYAAIGVARLGVAIDAFLLVGPLGLAIAALRDTRSGSSFPADARRA